MFWGTYFRNVLILRVGLFCRKSAIVSAGLGEDGSCSGLSAASMLLALELDPLSSSRACPWHRGHVHTQHRSGYGPLYVSHGLQIHCKHVRQRLSAKLALSSVHVIGWQHPVHRPSLGLLLPRTWYAPSSVAALSSRAGGLGRLRGCELEGRALFVLQANPRIRLLTSLEAWSCR